MAFWMAGALAANAAVPIDNHRFYSPYVCVEDHSTGSFYPSYFHTAANSWNESPAISVIYTNVPATGVTCGDYGYLDRQIIRTWLVQAYQANDYPWCAQGYQNLTSDGSRHETGPTIFYNYYRYSCQPDVIYAGTNAIATYITRLMGQHLGGKIWSGGSSVSIFNQNRWDLRWAQYHDKTACDSAMHRRYDAVNCA